MYMDELDWVKSTFASSSCAVLIDLDETIFNPLHKWRELISSEMDVSFSVEDIENAGSLDNYFRDSPRYDEFVVLLEKMRGDEELYTELPLISGARTGINKLLLISNLEICGYLTARPDCVVNTTIRELRKNNLPIRPILARPNDIDYYSTVDWKMDIITKLHSSYDATLIVIDDKSELAVAIQGHNTKAVKPIVSILFKGPLTHVYVERQQMETDASRHFYIAGWEQIPTICAKYAFHQS